MNEYVLGEECEVINGYAFESKDYVDSGILNFRIVNIGLNAEIDKSDVRFLPNKFIVEYKDYLLNADDIIIVMVGATRGKMFYIKNEILPALMNQNMWRVVPKNSNINKKFLYFFLKSEIQNFAKQYPEDARGFFRKEDFKKIRIPKISLSEQQKIAYILSQIQTAIELEIKIIQNTTELKNALIYKFFTEGTKSETQKETDIGKMPKSWNVLAIEGMILDTITRNPSNSPEKMIKYVDVSCVSNQNFIITEHQYVSGKEAPGRARKVINENDIIFATIRPSLKRIARVTKNYNDEYCSTAFCVLRCDEKKLYPAFLFYYLQTENFINRITKMQSGASYPAVTDANVKALKIPIPSLQEQLEIGEILEKIDEKISNNNNKLASLKSLFQTTLNELITGQISAKNLDFDQMETRI